MRPPKWFQKPPLVFQKTNVKHSKTLLDVVGLILDHGSGRDGPKKGSIDGRTSDGVREIKIVQNHQFFFPNL